MLKKKKQKNENAPYEPELGMTSMIDIVFLLLIFFMCATKFKVPDYRLDGALPKDRGPVSHDIKPPLEVTEFYIKVEPAPAEGGAMRATFRIGRDMTVAAIELNEFVKQSYRELAASPQNHGKVVPAVIDGNAEVDFECVMHAFNACVYAGINEITFAAPRGGERGTI